MEGNPVFIYHETFNADKRMVEGLEVRYHSGRIGDSGVKEKLVAALSGLMEPMRRRTSYNEKRGEPAERTIRQGPLKMREIALETMRDVRKTMGLNRVMLRTGESVKRHTQDNPA